MRIRFALVTEGSSDRGLVAHLEDLCVRAGAVEVEGVAPDLAALPEPPGKKVADQVRAALQLVPGAQLVFVHRDADHADDVLAQRDIAGGIAKVEGCPPHVPVVPIQELEAWLLTDEPAIRTVAMNPGGSSPLGLPKASRIESTAHPKERLASALVAACNFSGRRLEKFRSSFPRNRAILLERLDIDGVVSKLPAWQRLVQDTTEAVKIVLTEQLLRRDPGPT